MRYKTALFTALIASLLGISAPASASHGWHGGRPYYAWHHAYRPRPVFYGHHGYGHRRDGAYLLGGLVVGSLLTSAWYDAQDRDVVYRDRDYSSTRVVRTERAREIARHLYRDLGGNCFEIRRNEAGDELREALPAAECDW